MATKEEARIAFANLAANWWADEMKDYEEEFEAEEASELMVDQLFEHNYKDLRRLDLYFNPPDQASDDDDEIVQDLVEAVNKESAERELMSKRKKEAKAMMDRLGVEELNEENLMVQHQFKGSQVGDKNEKKESNEDMTRLLPKDMVSGANFKAYIHVFIKGIQGCKTRSVWVCPNDTIEHLKARILQDIEEQTIGLDNDILISSSKHLLKEKKAKNTAFMI